MRLRHVDWCLTGVPGSLPPPRITPLRNELPRARLDPFGPLPNFPLKVENVKGGSVLVDDGSTLMLSAGDPGSSIMAKSGFGAVERFDFVSNLLIYSYSYSLHS